MLKEKQIDQPICPKCKSKTIVYRIKTNDYLCRRCGEIFDKKETK